MKVGLACYICNHSSLKGAICRIWPVLDRTIKKCEETRVLTLSSIYHLAEIAAEEDMLTS